MIKGLGEKIPNIHKSCFVAENAAVVGDVVIGENTSKIGRASCRERVSSPV